MIYSDASLGHVLAAIFLLYFVTLMTSMTNLLIHL